MAQFQNCFVYARYSSRGQRHGTSIERQLVDAHAYVDRKGWIITGEIIDDGRSAFHGHHRSAGALGTFEAEAREGCHVGSLLIVERLDRLERGGPEDTFGFITGLTANGVSIATIDGDELYLAGAKLDMAQMMMLLLKAQVAYEESAKKSERSKANWRIKYERAAANGTALSKRCPAWLEVRNGGYIIIAEKAAIVARIFTITGQESDAFIFGERVHDVLGKELLKVDDGIIDQFFGDLWQRVNRTAGQRDLSQSRCGQTCPRSIHSRQSGLAIRPRSLLLC